MMKGMQQRRKEEGGVASSWGPGRGEERRGEERRGEVS